MSVKDLVPMSLRYMLMGLRGRSIYSGSFDAYQCIFIHIPKAAGTSVAKALFGAGSRHVPCTEYEKANRKKFERYFKFAFVRNPWDRLHSAYHFLRRGGLNEADDKFSQGPLSRFDDFESFVVRGLAESEIRGWVHFRPQVEFIVDSTGQNAMDYIGQFENLVSDFNHVCRRLGVTRELPRLNVTPRQPYMNAYTPEMRDIVADVYSEDIAMLGYQFGE